MALAKAILLAVAIGYLAIAVLLWVAQERLMFLPVGVRGPVAAPPTWKIEPVSHRSSDGTRLAGALLLPPGPPRPLVIYYGGNAEEVTASAAGARETYGDRAILLMNYRGYGESEGRPGEKPLVADALEIFDWAERRADVDGKRVALHGRSLGSAVAVAVAAVRPVSKVVLTSPLASAGDLAAELYPWLPVRWMLRHPFDSLARAVSITSPVLVLVGDDDRIIPPKHSEKLAQHWRGPVERRNFPGFGHNDVHLHPGYAEAIRAFLDRAP